MLNRVTSLYTSFSTWRPSIWITIIVTFALAFVLTAPIYESYREGSGAVMNQHRTIQRQFDKQRFIELVRSWVPEGAADADAELVARIQLYNQQLIRGDFLLPIAYAFLLALLYARLSSGVNPSPTKATLWIFTFPFIAGFLDYIENLLHIFMLRGVSSLAGLDNLLAPLIAMAAAAAWTKFALLGFVILHILYLSLRRPYQAA